MAQIKAKTKLNPEHVLKVDFYGHIGCEIGAQQGPNEAPPAPARETRDVGSRAQYYPNKNG